MAKRDIIFQQVKTVDGEASRNACKNRVVGTIQIELPESLHQLGEEIVISANDKVLPMYEGKICFEVTLEDGTVTTFEGNLALWPNKQHSKAALEAVRRAKREAERKRKEEAKQKLISGLTPEQVQAFKELGIL